MSHRMTRLGGALLLETAGEFFLIGNLKRPTAFPAAGFTPPPQPIDALARPFIRLERASATPIAGPFVDLGDRTTGAALATVLAERLVVARNGSVSDRLWRLLFDGDPDADPPPADAVIDARYLVEIPTHLWNIVRDTVLKCT